MSGGKQFNRGSSRGIWYVLIGLFVLSIQCEGRLYYVCGTHVDFCVIGKRVSSHVSGTHYKWEGKPSDIYDTTFQLIISMWNTVYYSRILSILLFV